MNWFSNRMYWHFTTKIVASSEECRLRYSLCLHVFLSTSFLNQNKIFPYFCWYSFAEWSILNFHRLNLNMDVEKAKAHVPDPEYFEYNSRDAIIYALGSEFFLSAKIPWNQYLFKLVLMLRTTSVTFMRVMRISPCSRHLSSRQAWQRQVLWAGQALNSI